MRSRQRANARLWVRGQKAFQTRYRKHDWNWKRNEPSGQAGRRNRWNLAAARQWEGCRSQIPRATRRVERPTLRRSKQVYLGCVKLCAFLLFRLLFLGNTQTEVARMFSVKRFADPDFHTVGFGIFDQHPNPSCGLQDRPVPTDKLEGGNETQEGSKPGLHGGVVGVSCRLSVSVVSVSCQWEG